MTHIMINIKYHERLPILTNEKLGNRMIEDWSNYNHFTLMKRPEMHVFPSSFMEMEESTFPWDTFGLLNSKLQDSFSYVVDDKHAMVNQKQYHGYSGFGILKHAHISIHTNPEEKTMHVDLFSHVSLDSQKNKDFVEKYFEKGKSKVFKMEIVNRSV